MATARQWRTYYTRGSDRGVAGKFRLGSPNVPHILLATTVKLSSSESTVCLLHYFIVFFHYKDEYKQLQLEGGITTTSVLFHRICVKIL